jgi:hypothetical protein
LQINLRRVWVRAGHRVSSYSSSNALGTPSFAPTPSTRCRRSSKPEGHRQPRRGKTASLHEDRQDGAGRGFDGRLVCPCGFRRTLAVVGHLLLSPSEELVKADTGAASSPTESDASFGGVSGLATRVIVGDYGNGDKRRQRLGSYYSIVQRRVNELLS